MFSWREEDAASAPARDAGLRRRREAPAGAPAESGPLRAGVNAGGVGWHRVEWWIGRAGKGVGEKVAWRHRQGGGWLVRRSQKSGSIRVGRWIPPDKSLGYAEKISRNIKLCYANTWMFFALTGAKYFPVGGHLRQKMPFLPWRFVDAGDNGWAAAILPARGQHSRFLCGNHRGHGCCPDPGHRPQTGNPSPQENFAASPRFISGPASEPSRQGP